MPIIRKVIDVGKTSKAVIIPKSWLEYYEKEEGSLIMSEIKGAIPKLIVFIIGLLLALPSPINIGITILKALQSSIQFLPKDTATQIIERSILWLQIFGVILIILDMISIIVQFHRGEYF